MLRISDLDVAYDAVQALHGVSLQVRPGECVALVGANGAGKSTTLKAICGLISPKSGTIELNGSMIAAVPAHKRPELGIAYVPEGRRVFPEMTVLENLEVGAYNRRARSSRDKTLDGVFRLFPRLKERAHQMAGTLSGGEQQMLAIGRGLMSQPTLLMLDEPSLGLAPVVVEETYHKLSEIHKQGVSILLVEENIFRALSLADRGYVLENGKVVLEGSADELLNNEHVRQAYMGV